MPQLTFKCEVGSNPSESACDNDKPWTAFAAGVESGLYPEPALRVASKEATCPTCGTTGTAQTDKLVVVGPTPAAVERCPNCSAVIPAGDAHFCPTCGAKLEG